MNYFDLVSVMLENCCRGVCRAVIDDYDLMVFEILRQGTIDRFGDSTLGVVSGDNRGNQVTHEEESAVADTDVLEPLARIASA